METTATVENSTKLNVSDELPAPLARFDGPRWLMRQGRLVRDREARTDDSASMITSIMIGIRLLRTRIDRCKRRDASFDRCGRIKAEIFPEAWSNDLHGVREAVGFPGWDRDGR